MTTSTQQTPDQFSLAFTPNQTASRWLPLAQELCENRGIPRDSQVVGMLVNAANNVERSYFGICLIEPTAENIRAIVEMFLLAALAGVPPEAA